MVWQMWNDTPHGGSPRSAPALGRLPDFPPTLGESCIACRISGAVQHMVGCKGADTIFAITTDPTNGWIAYTIRGSGEFDRADRSMV